MTDTVLPITPAAADAVEDLTRISETLGRFRMLMGRRMIARTAIANTVPGLDLSHLDALDVMQRIEGEVTVGAIAEAMRMDPSRGSRIVAELVSRGVLRRDASQQDGRRSLLVMTELGCRLQAERRAVKASVLEEVLDGWSEEELAAFSHLFEKFIGRFETTYLYASRAEGGEAELTKAG